MFSFECFNHIYGESKNPYDPSRTPGGSSGGEGAIVRLGLAQCAIGSDIAGSLRIPALFNGVVTLKPTQLRLSIQMITCFFEFTGCELPKSGPCFNGYVLPTIGPITRDVTDLENLMESMINSIRGDLLSPPMKWKRDQPLVKKVGVMRQFDLIEISLANQRALDESAAILRKSGIEVVEFDLNDLFMDIYLNTLACFFKIDVLRQLISGKLDIGEPVVRDFINISMLSKIPHFMISLV